MEGKCCLHLGTANSTEKLIIFTADSLEKCYQKKNIRDNIKKKKSKYDVIVLPEKADGVVGYHSSCYKSYCSIQSKNESEETFFGNVYTY